MDKKLQSYYQLLGIHKQSSEEDFVDACCSLLNRIQCSTLPPNEKDQLANAYREAISAVTKDRKVFAEGNETCRELLPEQPEKFSLSDGIPVLWTSLAAICITVVIFFISNDYSFSISGLFYYPRWPERFPFFGLMSRHARLGTPYFAFMLYAIVFGGSFIRRCFSGGRSFAEASKICYPVQFENGGNNVGKRFLQEWIPIAICYPVGYFALGLLGYYPSYCEMMQMTYMVLSMFAPLSIYAWNHESY